VIIENENVKAHFILNVELIARLIRLKTLKYMIRIFLKFSNDVFMLAVLMEWVGKKSAREVITFKVSCIVW